MPKAIWRVLLTSAVECQPCKINDTLKQQIWDLSDDVLGLKAITEQVSVSRSTVYKVLQTGR